LVVQEDEGSLVGSSLLDLHDCEWVRDIAGDRGREYNTAL